MSTAPALEILAIGQAASDLRCSLGTFQRAAADVGAGPAMTIDHVPHYSAADVDRIGERVRELQDKKHN